VLVIALICRRPSGIDQEFLIQLFVEPVEGTSFVYTQQLLNKMFLEQGISFAKVRKSCIIVSIIFMCDLTFTVVPIKVTATNASLWQKVQVISMHHSFIRAGY